jgi:hypothetical protein
MGSWLPMANIVETTHITLETLALEVRDEVVWNPHNCASAFFRNASSASLETRDIDFRLF